MARLGDICEILNGFAFKSEQYVDEGVRIIRITNVQKGYIEDNTPVFYPSDSQEVKKYALEADDLLMSLTGNVGRVARLNKQFLPAALNQRVACIRIKNEAIINKSYLFNLLNSDYFEEQCVVSAKGVAQKNMSTEWLREYEIPLLSMEEQQKIATVLDKVTNLISLRKQQLAKLDELVKARFVEMFGDPEYNLFRWKTEKMEKLCTVGSSKRIYQRDQVSNGVAFLRISDLVNRIDTGVLSCDLYISEEQYDELNKQGLVPVAGDILITARGTLGRCYIIADNDKFYFQDGMITWLSRFDDRVTSLYISYLFSMPGFRKQIDNMQAGSTVAYLSIAMAKKLDVMLPPKGLQEQFAAFTQQVDKQKLTIQQSRDKLEVLKKSLMQGYFK